MQKSIEKHEKAKTKQQKITFIKDLLRCFYHLIENNKDNSNNSQCFKMDTYLEKTPDDYLFVMVEHIMNSIDIGKTMNEYISDIRRLTTYINEPNSKTNMLDNFLSFKFICDSLYY